MVFTPLTTKDPTLGPVCPKKATSNLMQLLRSKFSLLATVRLNKLCASIDSPLADHNKGDKNVLI